MLLKNIVYVVELAKVFFPEWVDTLFNVSGLVTLSRQSVLCRTMLARKTIVRFFLIIHKQVHRPQNRTRH